MLPTVLVFVACVIYHLFQRVVMLHLLCYNNDKLHLHVRVVGTKHTRLTEETTEAWETQ